MSKLETNRADFITLLQKVAPALSRKDLVPVLSCFCFDGKFLTTYDDVVALRVESPLALKGGLRGQALLDFLNHCVARDLVIDTSGEGELKLTAGRSSLKLPVLDPKDFVFELPNTAGAIDVGLDPIVAAAFRICTASMGLDPAHPWRLGVTIYFEKDGIHFYASDGFSGTRVVVACEGLESVAGALVVMPPRFVELFIEASKRDEPEALLLAKEWVEVTFKSGLRLFSRTVGEGDIEKFKGAFTTSITKGREQHPQFVPEGFVGYLDRALVVLNSQQDKVATFQVGEGVLRILAESPVGVVDDEVEFKEHLDITVKANPELLKTSLDGVERISFTPQCIYLQGPGFVRVVRSVIK